MARWRKKPIVVEAFEWVYDENTGARSAPGDNEMPDWLIEAMDQDTSVAGALYLFEGTWMVNTIEGEHKVNSGDWIIRGVAGELYACKPDIFDATYEPVGAYE